MTACVVSERAYHRAMTDGLPHPSEALTISEIREQQARVIEILEPRAARCSSTATTASTGWAC